MADHPRVCCTIPSELEEAVPELLSGLALHGCQLEPLASSSTRLTVYVGSAEALDETVARLTAAGARAVVAGSLPDRDWMESYRAAVRAFPVGSRWWIDPHPEAPAPAPDDRLRLVVEPRMAFGSGSHESTRLVLLELEDTPCTGRSVLDVGTGSGILALAAHALGARWVLGLDLDPVAVWVARQTAALQERSVSLDLLVGGVDALGRTRFDVVLCNMIPQQFVPLLPALERALAMDGRLLLSGILGAEQAEVEDALASAGLAPRSQRRLGEWVGIVAGRIATGIGP